MTLFSAALISKDRESALLQRLYTTPLTASDFIFGYASAYFADCGSAGSHLLHCGSSAGLGTENHSFVCGIVSYSRSRYFTLLWGLSAEVFLHSKQVGGICGALLTNLSAWLSGIWFDVDLVGRSV